MSRTKHTEARRPRVPISCHAAVPLELLICAAMALTCAEAFISELFLCSSRQSRLLPPPLVCVHVEPQLTGRVSSPKRPLSRLDVKRGTLSGELENSRRLPGANPHWPHDVNPNGGFPDQPAGGFDKAPPKTSLTPRQSGTAATWILNVVEGAHWLIALPTFLGSYAVMLHHDFWLHLYAGSELRVLLWCLAPFFGFVGALPAFVMHTYESWQVAPFKNPVEGAFRLQDYNNGWLRAIVYKYVLIFQSVGLLMASHGYDGFGTVGISAALLLLAYMGDQSKKTTFEFNGQPVFPVPIVTIPLFVWSVVFNLSVSVSLASHVGDLFAHWGLIASPLLIAAGGVVEGVIAESTFNQWIHFCGVVILLAGSSLELYSLFQAPGLFV